MHGLALLLSQCAVCNAVIAIVGPAKAMPLLQSTVCNAVVAIVGPAKAVPLLQSWTDV
jgi:hypothetical protein